MLNSLKYFCEDARDYAIACAGSLLDVALNRQGASFPVGKVDLMTLYPLSFSEYLRAIDSRLHSSYMMIDGSMPVPEVLHGRLIEAYKAYLALGGMPEAVSDFADNREWQAVGNSRSRRIFWFLGCFIQGRENNRLFYEPGRGKR